MLQNDEDGLLDTSRISPGTMLLFVTYVGLINSTVGDYRRAVEKSTIWNQSPQSLLQARAAIGRATIETVAIFLALVLLATVIVAKLVHPLDPRMIYIVNGLSRVVSGVIVAAWSIQLAIWIGMYRPWFNRDFQSELDTTGSIVELKRRVRRSISKKLLRGFLFLLLFVQEVAHDVAAIPISMAVGMFIGLLLLLFDWIVYKSRRCQSVRCRRCVGIWCVLFLVSISVFTLGAGIAFIAAVWDAHAQEDVLYTAWDASAMGLAILALPMIHFLAWFAGKRRHTQSVDHDTVATKKPFFSDRNIHTDHGVEKEQLPNDKAADVENVQETGKNITAVDKETGESILLSVPGEERRDSKSIFRKAFNYVVWLFYLIPCCAFFFGTIINIGSSQQQRAVREKLPQVYKLIYEDMDEGPVCAFDNQGSASNITTFSDKDAAHDTGFLILHCGACGACSDWENLEREYTTRDILASEGRKCAQQSLFGSGYDTLVECLEEESIGFQGECAICWADDIICTKKFCAIIGLQSFLINTLTNFEVGEDTITAATCEEAHCEAGNPGHFVSCSGATRRRMNVTSSISRPGSQQCGIVDVRWDELFPGP